MTVFTFFKMRGHSNIDSFDILDFDCPEQARVYALSMLKQTSYEEIEVSDGKTSLLVRLDEDEAGRASMQ